MLRVPLDFQQQRTAKDAASSRLADTYAKLSASLQRASLVGPFWP